MMMINFDYIKPDDVVLQCGGTNRNIVCLTFVFPIVPLRQMIQRLLLLKPGYSREACGVGGLFLNLFFSEILILHIPKLCSLVYCFQNCFCFLSTTFPFHVGTFFGFNGKMTESNKMAENHFSGVQNGSEVV